jgi:toxin FitB
MKYLVDTNVISELVARQPDERVLGWIRSVREDQLFLSVITIGEIKKGIERLPDSPRKPQLTAWLEQDLLERFKDRILSLDTPILLAWGAMTARLQAICQPLPAIDSLIAAQAIHHSLTLATRNLHDFASSGVQLVNPWEMKH